jgi:hypothetical protein
MKPEGQVLQYVRSVLAVVPAGQSEHNIPPSLGLNLPNSHIKHELLTVASVLGDGWALPREHRAQIWEATEPANLPLGQLKQEVAPVTDDSPTAHELQAVLALEFV